MGAAFSNLAIVSQLFATTAKADLMTSVTAQLNAAGWTTVSGAGTANVLFQSGLTPQGLQLRARMKDNGGSCVDFSIETVNGGVVGTNANGGPNAGWLFPGVQYHIVASAYQFCIYAPNNFAQGARFVLISCPFIVGPNPIPANAGFGLADTTGDGAPPGQADSLRTNLTQSHQNSVASSQIIWDGSIYQQNATNAQTGPDLIFPTIPGGFSAGQVQEYSNGNIIEVDPLIVSMDTTASAQYKLRGQLWDATIVFDSFNCDTTGTWNGHNWTALTNQNTGTRNQRGTVFLAVS